MGDAVKVRVPVSDSPSPTPQGKHRESLEWNKGSRTAPKQQLSGTRSGDAGSIQQSKGTPHGASDAGTRAHGLSRHSTSANGRSIAPFDERHQPAAKTPAKIPATASSGPATPRKGLASKAPPGNINWSTKTEGAGAGAGVSVTAGATPAAAAAAAAAGGSAPLDAALALNVRQCTLPFSHAKHATTASAAVSSGGAARSGLSNSQRPSLAGAAPRAPAASLAGAAAIVVTKQGQLVQPIKCQMLTMGEVPSSGARSAPASKTQQQRGLPGEELLQQLLMQQQQSMASLPGIVLDGRLLLEAGGAAEPGELVTADLSSQDLSSIADSSCLAPFTALAQLDLSDNRLASLAALAALPSLRCLGASANRLTGLTDMSGGAICIGSSSTDNVGTTDGSSNARGARSSGSGAAGTHHIHTPSRHASMAGYIKPGASEDVNGVSSSRTGTNRSTRSSMQGWSASLPGAAEGAAHVEGSLRQGMRSSIGGANSSGGTGQQHGDVRTSADGSSSCASGSTMGSSSGFTRLEALDVSYNCLAADEVLGAHSPLAQLPRLSQLDASGNALGSLPSVLGTFKTLHTLNLTHNQLKSACLVPLAQLPALTALDLSHNCISSCPAAAAAQGCFTCLQLLNLGSNRLECVVDVMPLLSLPSLLRLVLLGTPAAARARLKGQPPEHQLPHTQVEVITHTGQRTSSTASSSTTIRQKQYRLLHPPPAHLAPILEAPPRAANLFAAAQAQLAAVPHEVLVAAFTRVEEGIEAWRLATVEEEEEGWDGPGFLFDEQQQRQQTAGAGDEQEGPFEDNTFLTGVGIFDHGDTGAVTGAAGDAGDTPEDPTERVARLLGLDVQLLAHKSGRFVSDNAGAIASLKHALVNPLVDPDAGLAPDQHHMAATATSRNRRLERQLQPLPQPIPVALDTKVQKLQTIEGTLSGMKGRLQALESSLLQQLSAQAERMTKAATATTLPVPRAVLAEGAVLPVKKVRVHSAGSSGSEGSGGVEENEVQQEQESEDHDQQQQQQQEGHSTHKRGQLQQEQETAVTAQASASHDVADADANGQHDGQSLDCVDAGSAPSPAASADGYIEHAELGRQQVQGHDQLGQASMPAEELQPADDSGSTPGISAAAALGYQ